MRLERQKNWGCWYCTRSCSFICNYGNATGAEILEFAMRIKEEVANKFGIVLQEEVNIL
jgi:UDP-N-acetylenolpyruvoylglucosamine reductase